MTCLHGLNPLAGLKNTTVSFRHLVLEEYLSGELRQSGPDHAGPSLTERKIWCSSLREG